MTVTTTKKNLAITAISLGVLAIAGIAVVAKIAAEETTEESSPLVQNLAERFGVAESEVEAVFSETRDQLHEARFDKLVEEGTLTQEQADALKTIQDEHQTKIEEINAQSLTAEERREAMESLRSEMEAAIEALGIEDFPFGLGKGQGMGGRGMNGGLGERMFEGDGFGMGEGMGRGFGMGL